MIWRKTNSFLLALVSLELSVYAESRNPWTLLNARAPAWIWLSLKFLTTLYTVYTSMKSYVSEIVCNRFRMIIIRFSGDVWNTGLYSDRWSSLVQNQWLFCSLSNRFVGALIVRYIKFCSKDLFALYSYSIGDRSNSNLKDTAMESKIKLMF